MSTLYRDCAETIGRLHLAVGELERAAGLLQLSPLFGREWFELLRQKLLPQLRDDAFLVLAVVGGTNIGKSVIFNHLAGSRTSATSPLASGTKHPVCLVPLGFSEKHDLQQIFDGFTLQEWTGSDAPLEEHAEHMLYWQPSETTPENLLVLDTPDIDSDAQINWQRAEHVRRCADVLIAVLTQQKYNDAAVKEFFRKAAAEDKAVIVVFNQCLLPDDEQYWPIWLDTFCGETGIRPEYVYIAPNDRAAAEENRLPFYERTWPCAAEPTADRDMMNAARSLTDDLSRLHFEQVKLRTLRGSLNRLLDSDTGVPAYLREVEARSADVRAAAERLGSESVVRIRDWPSLANPLLVTEIRTWWRAHQEGWSRRVHGFYDTVGQGLTWPFRFAKKSLQGEQTNPLDVYRQQEWSAVLRSVEDVYEKLSWMSESGSDLLRPRIQQLLAGRSRAALLTMLREEHDKVQLDVELEEVVAREMQSFQVDSPELYKFYKQLNTISAAVRPVASVVLFTLGWGPAGHAVAPFVADAAAQAMVHIVADVAGGTTAAVAGEAALSGVAGKGSGYLQAKFQGLQTAFMTRRIGWLVELLKQHLLGPLPEELQAAAGVPQSDVFLSVQETLTELAERMQVGQPESPRVATRGLVGLNEIAKETSS